MNKLFKALVIAFIFFTFIGCKKNSLFNTTVKGSYLTISNSTINSDNLTFYSQVNYLGSDASGDTARYQIDYPGGNSNYLNCNFNNPNVIGNLLHLSLGIPSKPFKNGIYNLSNKKALYEYDPIYKICGCSISYLGNWGNSWSSYSDYYIYDDNQTFELSCQNEKVVAKFDKVKIRLCRFDTYSGNIDSSHTALLSGIVTEGQ